MMPRRFALRTLPRCRGCPTGATLASLGSKHGPADAPRLPSVCPGTPRGCPDLAQQIDASMTRQSPVLRRHTAHSRVALRLLLIAPTHCGAALAVGAWGYGLTTELGRVVGSGPFPLHLCRRGERRPCPIFCSTWSS